uniref:Uncharacterized protein n=1 Tax=Xenopus tropicalis TaxID=8364 RepID=A0A6I8RAK6_XENTR
MNPVSTNEYYGLRVASALIGIVAGSIIVGVSDSCGAAAVGGIFLGALYWFLFLFPPPFISSLPSLLCICPPLILPPFSSYYAHKYATN